MCWKRMPGSARPGDQDNLVACHLFSISAAPSGWWNLYAHAKIGGRLVDRQSIEQLFYSKEPARRQKDVTGREDPSSIGLKVRFTFLDWLKFGGYFAVDTAAGLERQFLVGLRDRIRWQYNLYLSFQLRFVTPHTYILFVGIDGLPLVFNRGLPSLPLIFFVNRFTFYIKLFY